MKYLEKNPLPLAYCVHVLLHLRPEYCVRPLFVPLVLRTVEQQSQPLWRLYLHKDKIIILTHVRFVVFA